MNPTQILLMVLWIFIVILIAGLFLVTFLIGKYTVKDNPGKALVFVKTGLHVSKPKRAKLTTVNSYGSRYKYGNKLVMIPKKYSEVYHNNCRMVFVQHLGQLIASPFDGDVMLTKDESETLIYELTASGVGAEGMRALKGNKTANVIIISIIAFIVGAILTYGVTQYMAVTQRQQTNPQTAPQQQPKVIEVE